MKAVIQRVSQGSVQVAGETVGRIEAGFVILLGVAAGDSPDDAAYLVEKIVHLRVFGDAEGRMNRSLLDTSGAVLAISQFTLLADTRRGRRPGFAEAAAPELAAALYRLFIDMLKQRGIPVEQGVFGAHMVLDIRNDGPVTILLDSKSRLA